jgi:hypothetical protein
MVAAARWCDYGGVEEELQQRIARNESIFRDVNEAIEKGHWPGEEAVPMAFRCECGRLGCSRLIEMRGEDYERVRAHPRRFFVASDHDISAVETIVETNDSYVVVEKRGEAGRLAAAANPRS